MSTIFYKLFALLLAGLAAAVLAEKYRLVRGARVYDARILDCRRAAHSAPGRMAGGYRYLVELFVDGVRVEAETNDSFWTPHTHAKGRVIRVWYNPAYPCLVERKSIGTEALAAAFLLLAFALWIFF